MNAEPKWGISEYSRMGAAIAGGVCIAAGIFMVYQEKTMPIANVSIPAGLIFLIAGLILFAVASRRSTTAQHSSTSSKFWYLIVSVLVIAGISFFSGYWLHKSLYSAQSVNPQVAPNLEQNLNALARENINWAKEVINRADRLVTYGSIAVGTIIGLLGLFFAIFGAKWIRQHKDLVESHDRMSEIFRRCEEEALSVTKELALPPLAIDIIDKEKMGMVEERIKELEGKTRPIEEIDQMVASLELFRVELEPEVFVQLGHYYRYRALVIKQKLEKKKKRGIEKEAEKELVSQMRKEFLKALDRYKTASRKKKDFAAAHYNIGTTYIGLGKYKESLASLNKGIKISEDQGQFYFQPYLFKGIALDELNKFEEAIDAYKEAYHLNHNFRWTVYNIGCSYARWGESQKKLELRNKKWNEALVNFSDCFKDKKIREYAKKDPELKRFREEFCTQFDELIKKYEDHQP